RAAAPRAARARAAAARARLPWPRCSQLLPDPRSLAAQPPEADDQERERDANRDEQPDVATDGLPRGGRARVDDRVADLLCDRGERVAHDQVLQLHARDVL